MKTYKLFTYLLPLMLVTVQASQISDKERNNNTNLESDKKDLELHQAIEKYLLQFFDDNHEILKKPQNKQHKAVLVIGHTGSGKSTLIGGLRGDEFTLEKQKLIEILPNGREFLCNQELLINKSDDAPEISHNKMESKTILPKVYLDKETDLVFIDTAGLGNVIKDSNPINICSAIDLRSLIDAIGGIQCIIGVVSYKNFIEGKGSNAFYKLLVVIRDMLKNTPPEKLASSIVLAFTNVPMYITKCHIYEALEHQYENLMQKKKHKEMREKEKVAEVMYKTFFPSCYSLENKKDVPFFLIRKDDLLKQSLVRKKMLSTLEKATKVHSKDISIVLHPHWLKKITDWLAKRAQSIVNNIRRKEYTKQKITHTKKYLLFTQKQLCKKKQLLNHLTDPNNQDKKATFKKCLNQTIQKNTQRIQTLNTKIKNNTTQVFNKETERQQLDTHQTILHTKISGNYNKYSKQYHYSYNNENVPIHHINYHDQSSLYNTKDPKSGARISDHYKIVAITKNYDQGILNITLEHDMRVTPCVLPSISTVLASGVSDPPLPPAKKHSSPGNFHIYAKKKHIYHNKINILKRDIRNLARAWLKRTKDKKRLQKENKFIRNQLIQLQLRDSINKQYIKKLYNSLKKDNLKQAILDFLQHKQMIEQTKIAITVMSKEVKSTAHDLQTWQILLNILNKEIKQNHIIPHIITHTNSFISFNKGDQNNIDICKQYYINNLKKNNQDQNTHINSQNMHTDCQLGGKLEETKEDDGCDNNNNNSTFLTSSTLLGTSLLASSLSKKKN